MPTRSADRNERLRLEETNLEQLRACARRGPGHGMKGVGRAAKSEVVDYLIAHPDLRPPNWSTSQARRSLAAVPPTIPLPQASASRPAAYPPAAAPRPAAYNAVASSSRPAAAPQPAAPAPLIMQSLVASLTALSQSVTAWNNTAPGATVPPQPVETPAQEAARRQREWAAIEGALDIEEQFDGDDWDTSDMEDEELGSARHAEKKRRAAVYRAELSRRETQRMAEHWRRAEEAGKFAKQLAGVRGMPAHVQAEWNRQEKVREDYWKAEDAKREAFWEVEDRERHYAWEDKLDEVRPRRGNGGLW